MKPTSTQLKRLNDVITELNRYRGGRVTKGEHPLHAAVVELEKLCRKSNRPNGRQIYRLYQPACLLWFNLLWSSRGAWRASRPAPQGKAFGEGSPELAREYRDALKSELLEWRENWPIH